MRSIAVSLTTHLLAALSLVVLLVLCDNRLRAAEPEVVVLSYNIRYLNQSDGQDVWEHRRGTVCEVISHADIVGLQEVVYEQLQDIQRERTEFEWYSVGRDNGQQAGESVPLGWKKDLFECDERGTFWLSPTPSEIGSRGWDAALPRIASWARLRLKSSGQELLVLNTHFDHRGQEARRQSAIQIREWLSANRREGRPVIMTGDLNATEEGPPLRALLEPMKGVDASDDFQLQDTRSLSPSADPGPNSTWNGFEKIVEGRRIDFILAAGSLQVTAFQTLNPETAAGRFASDHLPVQATIRLPD